MIIDRIEGSVAVVELRKGETVDVPLYSISGRARDGAALRELGDGLYEVDERETSARASKVNGKAKALFRRRK